MSTRTLTDARWSSAVRCPAKAIHEGIGTTPDPDAHTFMERYFNRGKKVGRFWAILAMQDLRAEGHEVEAEAEIPWGIGFVGHADLLDHTTKTVYEAYHGAGAPYREVKGWQAAGYADALGEEWTAELAVIDSTDDDEDSFAVQPYAINVDNLREKVRKIKSEVVAGVTAGHVPDSTRVSDERTGPFHSECRSCPFRSSCWANWRPAPPEFVPGADELFEQIRITHADLQATNQKAAQIKQRLDELKQEARPLVTPGVPVEAGGALVKLSVESERRVTFRVTDYLRAGHLMPPETLAFVRVAPEPVERWTIKPAGGA